MIETITNFMAQLAYAGVIGVGLALVIFPLAAVLAGEMQQGEQDTVFGQIAIGFTILAYIFVI